jgi:hypothetical protein
MATTSAVQSLVSTGVPGDIPTVTVLEKLVARTKTRFRTQVSQPQPEPSYDTANQSQPQFDQVWVPHAIIQRLKRPLYTSKLKIQINGEVVFKSEAIKLECETKLQNLINCIDASKEPWPKRTVGFSFVAVIGSNSDEELPWICVHGLESKDDIIYFHMRLSTIIFRTTYNPLKLCYDRSLIKHGAAKEVKVLEGYGDTLCGRSIEHKFGGQIWYSTFGGILQVDEHFYALTTSHQPEVTNTIPEILPTIPEFLFDLTTHVEDVQRATIIDNSSWIYAVPIVTTSSILSDGIFGSRASETPHRANFGRGHEFMLDGETQDGPNGSDWSLYPMEASILLPNAISVEEIHKYITSVEEKPRKVQAIVLCGREYIITGQLSSNISYLKPSPRKMSMLCWTVQLDKNHGEKLMLLIIEHESANDLKGCKKETQVHGLLKAKVAPFWAM